MSDPVFAAIVAVALVVFHLQQVDILSGSVEEFWTRADAMARASKLFFGLSLCSCFLIVVSPILGGACALAFISLHLGFSMEEWKR
jgi:hypothetical protein